MNKATILSTILLIVSGQLSAQTEDWNVYLASYEKGPGSTTLNLDLINSAPNKEFPYVLITGVNYTDCRSDGLPNADAFEKLYDISEKVEKSLAEVTPYELAGTFTYQCKRLDYLYVGDTTLIKDKLINLYQSEFGDYKYYISIRPDRDWEAYLNFLYPNAETQEYMSNEKVLSQLRQAGDKLVEPRQIDHWLYFPDVRSRNLFIQYIHSKAFKVEGQDKLPQSALPFQLHISRLDSVSQNSIGGVTLELRRKAKELKGEYDGWETFVIKE